MHSLESVRPLAQPRLVPAGTWDDEVRQVRLRLRSWKSVGRGLGVLSRVTLAGCAPYSTRGAFQNRVLKSGAPTSKIFSIAFLLFLLVKISISSGLLSSTVFVCARSQ